MNRPGPGRPAQPRAASAFILAGFLTLAGFSASAKDDPFPLPVKIEVVQEGTVAADRSLRLLEGAILTELRRRGCVGHASTGGEAREVGAHSVVLRVILREVVEEARWDMHTGARAEAQQISGENSVWPTAFVRLLGQSQVLAGPQQRVAYARDFNVAAEWTSKAPGGNLAEEARGQALDKLAAEARKTLCASRRRLLERIAELSAP